MSISSGASARRMVATSGYSCKLSISALPSMLGIGYEEEAVDEEEDDDDDDDYDDDEDEAAEEETAKGKAFAGDACYKFDVLTSPDIVKLNSPFFFLCVKKCCSGRRQYVCMYVYILLFRQ